MNKKIIIIESYSDDAIQMSGFSDVTWVKTRTTGVDRDAKSFGIVEQ